MCSAPVGPAALGSIPAQGRAAEEELGVQLRWVKGHVLPCSEQSPEALPALSFLFGCSTSWPKGFEEV